MALNDLFASVDLLDSDPGSPSDDVKLTSGSTGVLHSAVWPFGKIFDMDNISFASV
jgi:hypothetical protein